MRYTRTMLVLVAATVWCIWADARAEEIGTAITYQGQLKQGGGPTNGEYDFVFRLFDAASGPSQVGSDEPINDWPVSNGLLTVQIDFDSGVFTGDALWLEVAVRPGDSTGDHTILAPRQPVTAAPYALYALDGSGGAGRHCVANGADIHNTNAGNVGIGTTTPAASVLDTSSPPGLGSVLLSHRCDPHRPDDRPISRHTHTPGTSARSRPVPIRPRPTIQVKQVGARGQTRGDLVVEFV